MKSDAGSRTYMFELSTERGRKPALTEYCGMMKMLNGGMETMQMMRLSRN